MDYPYELISYDLHNVRKIFFNIDLHSHKVLIKDDEGMVVMFRSRGYEEEYTLDIQHKGYQLVDKKEFQFSDKWDNYNIVVAEYIDEDFLLQDEFEEE